MGDESLSTDPLRRQYDADDEAWKAVEESFARSGLSDETKLLIQKYMDLEFRIYGYERTAENTEGMLRSIIAALEGPRFDPSTPFDPNAPAYYIDLAYGRGTGLETQRAIASEKGSQGNTHQSGDPVELFSGEFVHGCEDLLIKGAGIDFVFRRTYRNQALYDGPLGASWDHVYNVWIWRWTEGNVLVHSTGHLREEPYRRHPRFGQPGFSYWAPPDGQHATIHERGTSFVWENATGLRHIFEQDVAAPAYHRLARIEDRFGNYLAFAYQGRRLVQVEVNHPERLVSFGYDTRDRITAITDFTGRRWSYAYDDFGDLVAVTSPATAELPGGARTRYDYSSATESRELQHHLLRIFDPAGRCLVENDYGRERNMLRFGRVVRQRLGGGESTFEYERVVDEFDFDYGPADRPTFQVNVVEPNGHACHYLYNRAGNLLLREDEVVQGGVRRRFQVRARYNADGALIAQHSAEGTVTQYYYARDHYLAIHGTTDAEVATHDALTDTDRRAFRNLLAVVKRAVAVPNPAPSYPRGYWGEYLPPVNGPLDAADVVLKYSYEPRYNGIATISDARFTRSADPNFPEGPDHQRTLTRFHYTGPPGDPTRLLARIEHPDMTLPDGSVLTNLREEFTYDAAGRLVEQRDRDGTVTRFEHHGPGSGPREGFTRAVTLDPGGLDITTRFEVNVLGLVTVIRHPRGEGAPPGSFESRFELDELDQIVRRRSPAPFGFEVRSAFDAGGLVVRIESELRDETGAPILGGTEVQRFCWDEACRLVRESSGGVDETTHLATRHEYGPSGELVALVGPAGRRTTLEYDPRLNAVARTRGAGGPRPATSRAEYDGDSRLTAHVSALGHRTRFAYDPLGRLVRVEDPLGNTVCLDYDKNGNILSERFFEWRGTGHVLLGRTEYGYDEHDHRSREAVNEFPDPLPVADLATAHLASPGPGILRETRYFRDAKGRVIRVVNPAGEEATIEYDRAGRVTARQDPAGNRVELTHDRHGNLVRRASRELVRDPESGVVVREEVFPEDFVYDELDRLVERIDGLGNAILYAYDSRSYVVRVVDQLGNVSRCRYDVHGRKVADVRALTDTGLGGGTPIGEAVTRYEYDADGNVTAVVDGNGNRVEQAYDDAGRRVQVTFPDGSSTAAEYDDDDNVVLATDANRLRRRFQHDPLGRVTRTDVDRSLLAPGVTVGGEEFERYEYDGLGRVILEENTFCRIASRLDSRGQPYEEVLTLAAPGSPVPYALERRFDPAGRCVGVTYPSGRVIAYGRDAAGRVTEVLNTAKGTAYQGSGAFPDQYPILARTFHGRRPGLLRFGNGASTAWRFDRWGRPIELACRGAGGSPLRTVQQLHDGAGNTRLRNGFPVVGGGGERLAYDSLARLATIRDEAGTAPFDPAPFAPLTSPPPGAIPDGQSAIDATIGALALDPPSATFEYDLASNRVQERRSGQPPVAFGSNALNQYTTVGGQTLAYDANGNLRSDGRFAFLYDCRDLLVAVTDLSNGEVTEFCHDARGRRIAEASGSAVTHLVPDGVNLIEEYRAGGVIRQYVHTGDLDAYCQVAQAGTELWCHTDHLGSPLIVTGPSGAAIGGVRYDPFGRLVSQAGVALPFGFCGRRFDALTGTYDFRSREYSPELGRYLQRDALGLTIAANLYQYALDNPPRYLDPFGTEPGPVRRAVSRFLGGAWGALKNMGNFLRLGLWDSWAQSFSDSSRERVLAAQQWFGELYGAVDEGRFLQWTGEGLEARMKAIVEAEERGDHFGAGEVFGDTAFTAYGVFKGGVGTVKGGLRFGTNVRTYGFVEATKGVGYGFRFWATNYRGVGVTRGAVAEATFDTVRGSPYANYPTYYSARQVSRMVWQAERGIQAGRHNDIPTVRTYRRFAGPAARRFYGSAVNRVVDQALGRSADPFLANDLIRQGAFGRNAKGNAIFPDYRVNLGNQSVIDITTRGQAGHALKYPAGNVIEPYTGTVRYPEAIFPPFLNLEGEGEEEE